MSEELKKKLFNKKENGWKDLNNEEKNKIFEFSDNYMNFLNISKTEKRIC